MCRCFCLEAGNVGSVADEPYVELGEVRPQQAAGVLAWRSQDINPTIERGEHRRPNDFLCGFREFLASECILDVVRIIDQRVMGGDDGNPQSLRRMSHRKTDEPCGRSVYDVDFVFQKIFEQEFAVVWTELDAGVDERVDSRNMEYRDTVLDFIVGERFVVRDEEIDTMPHFDEISCEIDRGGHDPVCFWIEDVESESYVHGALQALLYNSSDRFVTAVSRSDSDSASSVPNGQKTNSFHSGWYFLPLFDAFP